MLCRLYAMTDPSNTEVVCASCGTAGAGRFCSSCGAALESAACTGCGAALSPGERFCHMCGRPTGTLASAPVPGGRESGRASLPWIIGAIALVSLLAFLAGRAVNKPENAAMDETRSALSQAGPDAGGIVRGPDISQFSPEESADRLFKRVMLLASQGKSDSVQFFAPMAINAYQMLSPMNAGQRYDVGRIAEVAGAFPLAKAQADTILAANPNQLLGLVLGARVAGFTSDSTGLRSYQARLLSAYDSEVAKGLPDYKRHADDISNALADARRSKK